MYKIKCFTNYKLIRMGDARVDAIDDFAKRTYRRVMWFKGHGPSKSGARGECLKIGTWYDPKIPSSKGTKLSQKFEVLGLGESAISRR